MSTAAEADRYAIVAPMKIPDDTESGLCVASAILEHSKLHRPQHSGAEELATVPHRYSKLNATAIAASERRRAMQLSAQSSSGNEHRVVARDWSAREPLVTRGGLVDSDSHTHPDEPLVRICFRSSVPLKGKSSFAMAHRMSATVREIRDDLVHAIGLRPTGEVVLRRSDTGDVLDLEETLLGCGFRFPPLLRLDGWLHEVHLVCAKPLGVRVPLAWHPGMTLTDLARSVHQRLQPANMQLVRLSVERHEGRTETPALGGDDEVECLDRSGTKHVQGATYRQLLPVQQCVAIPEPVCLNGAVSLCDLKFTERRDDPISVHWLRSKDGVPLVFSCPFLGCTTVDEVAEAWLELDRNPETLAAHLDLGALGFSNDGLVEATLASETPYDDEDEEVYFFAEQQWQLLHHQTRRQAYHGVAQQNASKGKAQNSSGERRRCVYAWTKAEVQQIYPQHVHTEHAVVFLSFAPPPSAVAHREPRFVSIDEDFTIPHLTDLGVLPGMEVLVEYYDPLTGRWSSEVTPVMEHYLGESSPTALGTNATAAPNAAVAALSARLPHIGRELLTIRTTTDNLTVRVPCTALTPMHCVQMLYWAACGALPMFTTLQADNSRLLQPHDTLASANMLPQATLYASHRPRPWLRESFPDVTLVGGHHTSFSNTELPRL